ncbi:hypothetical protein GCM10009789_37640 [Kribbella sancticallisti]|uniref:Uncharacterized protein n=1 Tax=Kribbella sancticallisti TaxID=460087 RepID=A0ABP4PJY4_9ACTN
MSLSSYRTVFITGIHMSSDNRTIRSVRWCGGEGTIEESPADDLARWIGTGRGHAYLKWPNGTTGPRIHVRGSATGPQLCTERVGQNLLLSLPHFPAHTSRSLARHRRS